MMISSIYATRSLDNTYAFYPPGKNHLDFCRSQVFVYRNLRKSRKNLTFTKFFCSGYSKMIVIGLAADSGRGKSTFMRRLASVFGGVAEPSKGGNPDSNTLIGDMITVICFDDYRSLDRKGRKEKNVTALHPDASNFNLMYKQVKALIEGFAIEKPIYNHATGLSDPPELIKPPKILVIEGLHTLFDPRVREILDLHLLGH